MNFFRQRTAIVARVELSSNRFLSTAAGTGYTGSGTPTSAASIVPPKDIRMPTPLSLGHGMRYHSPPDADTTESRTLVVMAGWMGAKEKQMRSYLNFYHQRNMDTISFAVGPNHVLFPATAMKQMQAVLDCCIGESEKFPLAAPPSRLIFHHFSVGGFLYGQILQLIANNPKYANLNKDIIRAQIFDSPPDYMNIPKGIARSMGFTPNGLGETVVEKSAQLFLKLNENGAGVMHRASSQAFHTNSVSAPSLWFYSKADPVADWNDCEIVTNKWRNAGMDLETCVWDNTPHIQHARVDPERYYGTLHDFLERHP